MSTSPVVPPEPKTPWPEFCEEHNLVYNSDPLAAAHLGPTSHASIPNRSDTSSAVIPPYPQDSGHKDPMSTAIAPTSNPPVPMKPIITRPQHNVPYEYPQGPAPPSKETNEHSLSMPVPCPVYHQSLTWLSVSRPLPTSDASRHSYAVNIGRPSAPQPVHERGVNAAHEVVLQPIPTRRLKQATVAHLEQLASSECYAVLKHTPLLVLTLCYKHR